MCNGSTSPQIAEALYDKNLKFASELLEDEFKIAALGHKKDMHLQTQILHCNSKKFKSYSTIELYLSMQFTCSCLTAKAFAIEKS